MSDKKPKLNGTNVSLFKNTDCLNRFHPDKADKTGFNQFEPILNRFRALGYGEVQEKDC